MYNEGSRVRDTVTELSFTLDRSGLEYELIFSDDGSTDDSAGIVSEYSQTHSNIRILCAPENRGKGAAVRAGMLAAKGDIAVFTDCDLAYGADAVLKISDTLKASGCDIAIGSRNLSEDGYAGYSDIRRRFSKSFLKILKELSGLTRSDCQCGLKAFTKRAREELFPVCVTEGFAFDYEILMRAEKLGFSVTELPVSVFDHNQHASKVRLFTDAIKMLFDVHKIKNLLK